MTQTTTKKYYDELNIFRALIVGWVVIGHSTHEGLDVISVLHGYAYSFHMIAFFTLSGFLFQSKIKKCTNVKITLLTIWERVKRLIVPYIFFTIVSLILKFFFEKYAFNELETNPLTLFIDFLLGQNNPNGGIWFLYALFLISVIAAVTSKINSMIMLIITSAIRILYIYFPTEISPLMYIAKYSFAFFIGVIIKENYDSISKLFDKLSSNKKYTYRLFVITVVAMGISIVWTYISLETTYNEYNGIANSLYNTVVWYLISQLINRTAMLKKFTMTIGDYGMDIYMIGYYIQIVLRVVLETMLGLPYVVYFTSLLLGGLLLPIPISKFIIRKIGLFKALMLGDFSKKKVNESNGK